MKKTLGIRKNLNLCASLANAPVNDDAGGGLLCCEELALRPLTFSSFWLVSLK